MKTVIKKIKISLIKEKSAIAIILLYRTAIAITLFGSGIVIIILSRSNKINGLCIVIICAYILLLKII